MTFSFSGFAEALKAGATISADDVLAARRWAWSDGGISAAEAEAIFELNGLARDRSNEWVDFFVEALTEFVVNEQSPRGYVDEAKADWLMARIDRDGRVETRAELELLVKVMETALNAPERLKSYALSQIEAAATTGEGPTRGGDALRPGAIDEPEVVLLRRLLFASGGEGAITVTRDEAEMLWRLKDACAAGDNAPGWKTLFVQAVGNYLMAHNLYHPLERGEAQRLESFANDHHSDITGFLGRMLRVLPRPPVLGGERLPGEDIGAAVARDEAVTMDEREWLKQHIDHDGARDPLEAALLAFIEEESGTRI
ncbi:MAG: hypothetical protein ACM3YM_04670 [Sphingomonadales bacterium]